MTGKLYPPTKDRRDIGQVVFLGETVEAAREISSCCVGVEAALESNNRLSDMVKETLNRAVPNLGRIQNPPSTKPTAIDSSGFRAIMFTDMVGSTEMTTQLGDTIAVELLRAHDAIIRRCLEQHGGAEVKHLGDGIMASFDDLPASVASAVKIQQELATHNDKSGIPIRVRIGVHAGEPVEESDDLFGSAVQMAARICGIAQPGAILVSREIKDACSGADLRFAPMGSETLKGFSEPVLLFSPA